MNTIKNIIDILGYNHSEFLFYRENILKSEEIKKYISYQVRHVLINLDPDAVFCVEGKPFVAFFDMIGKDRYFRKNLFKKIWNAKIPIIFLNYEDRVEIYNGYSLNTKNIELEKIEVILNENINLYKEFSFWKITSEDFWEKYRKNFDSPKIDNILLDNIKSITNMLRNSECKPFAINLILRLIFIRFLIDRGIDLDYEGFSSNIEDSKKTFLNVLKSKDSLYKLFIHLKNKFNGNLFELYENEQNYVDDNIMENLHDLMSGKLVFNTGQISLFPLYDFNIIPIELISNIYETFLGTQKQKNDSAFYTPQYLVDYILNQTIKPYLNANKVCKVLDPSCGSGIFLIDTLRSIIENNIDETGYIDDNEKLINLAIDNIFGIDKNEEAINVAIFSIYVTLLDYKDPKSLKSFKLPCLKEKNFFVSDFFDNNILEKFNNINLDFIIGNPPWGGVKGLHQDYCIKNNYENQNKEISRSFIYRTKDFCCKKTKCCLIVTSKLFYNSKPKAVAFRRWILSNAKIIKFIELSAVRELIFQKAKGPASVIFYSFSESEKENYNNDVDHIVLMPNIFFKLFNIIVEESVNCQFINQKLLFDYDWAWKTFVFGNIKDFLLIKRLKSKYPTLKEFIKQNNLRKANGLQTNAGEQDASHFIGKKVIDAGGIDAFYIDKQKYTIFDKNKIHRSRNIDIFNPPFVLVKKGFNTKNYKLRAAYCEDEFLYKDSLTGIIGENEDILFCIMGLINSSLYSYLNLMLGTSTGIEREQVFFNDVLDFPAIFDKGIVNISKKIFGLYKENKYDTSISENIDILDQYILEKMGLKDNNSIDYALNVQIPLLTKCYKYKVATDSQLEEYANIIINYFKKIIDSTESIYFNIYKDKSSYYNMIEFVITDKKESKVISESKNYKETIDLFTKFAVNKINDEFYKIKDIFYFEENSFYILKTNEFKNWHKVRAEIDLSKILDSILYQGDS